MKKPAARIAELAKLLRTYKDAYYNGEPLVSDAAYDALEDELRELDPSHPVIASVGAPAQKQTAWEKARHCPEVILIEGLFDYAALRQAAFSNVTCSLGTHLNADQICQLCDGPRTVYVAFDDDANQSGRQAAEQLAHRLAAHGISTRRVLLPEGHDPNSFFVGGGDAHQFQSFLEAAEP